MWISLTRLRLMPNSSAISCSVRSPYSRSAQTERLRALFPLPNVGISFSNMSCPMISLSISITLCRLQHRVGNIDRSNSTLPRHRDNSLLGVHLENDTLTAFGLLNNDNLLTHRKGGRSGYLLNLLSIMDNHTQLGLTHSQHFIFYSFNCHNSLLKQRLDILGSTYQC